MKKTYFAGFIAVAIIAFGLMAVPKTMAQKQTKEDRSVTIEGATPENPVVSLGKAFDKKSGKFVDGYAIVHYAKSASKPAPTPTPTACYGFLATGAKWRTIESWIVDSVNTGNLEGSFILQNMTKDISKWEDATDGIVGNSIEKSILGDGELSDFSITSSSTLNNKNEVTFAPIKNRGTIAVTYIWGIFGGLTSQRELMEWDQIYSTKYAWSENAAGSTTSMDFENIATHELGHAVGMGDLYTLGCAEQTMYGYAGYGQINKRDLHDGDITGIKALYN